MSQIELFDYSALAPDLQVAVKTATERIKLRMKRTAEDIIEIGKDLIAIKEKLPHGQFLPWIASEFEMSEPTAKNFMAVARRFGDKTLIISDFNPTVLYQLAAPSTPDEVVEQVIEKAASGETVTAKEVKDLKAKLREKEGEINQLKQSNQFVSAELKKQQELMVGIEATLQDSAKSLAEKMTEGEVKKATAELRNELTQLKAEKQRLEGAKALADSQLQEAKESYEKALEKFKKNPDPDTQKKLDALQAEYNQMQSNVTQAAYKLEKLREKEDQALSASIELERFFGSFNKLIANHPDAITAMGSRYLPESSLGKLDSLANTLEYWAQTIRKSIALARSDNATAIRAVDVEVVGNDDDEDNF